MGAVTSFVKKNWFLMGIVCVILFAKLYPQLGSKGGLLKPEITVKYIAVFIIFFNSGISLKSEDLGKALMQIRMHVFIQGFTFAVFPALLFTIASFIGQGLIDKTIIQGLRILSCLPPPVSSAVILTKAVGGNEAAAIFNSAFGSFLGIGVTPMLILYLVGSQASVPISSIFIQLSATVVLPLILGQWVRKILVRSVDIKRVPWGQIGSAILLLIIYTTFCDTFNHSDIDIDTKSLSVIIILVLGIQASLLVLVFTISRSSILKFSRTDTAALMFCCTHKSLTLGIPIIKIIFAHDPAMSLITIPILVYHPTQILLGGVLVPYIRSWILSGPSSGLSATDTPHSLLELYEAGPGIVEEIIHT